MEPVEDRHHVTLDLVLTGREIEMLSLIATTGGFRSLEATVLAGVWRLGRFMEIDVPPTMFDQANAVGRPLKRG